MRVFKALFAALVLTGFVVPPMVAQAEEKQPTVSSKDQAGPVQGKPQGNTQDQSE